MKFTLPQIATILCCLILFACYSDDPSPNTTQRLPFEDFSEFFDENNAQADTFTFNAGQSLTIEGPKGSFLDISENAFSGGGSISLVLKEALNKSDFILLEKMTLDGSTPLETTGALSFSAINNSGSASPEAPIKVRLPLVNGLSGDDLSWYQYQGDWSVDELVELNDNSGYVEFETEFTGWQMAAQAYTNANAVQLSIVPGGYGSIPHDMRAFAVLSDSNVILPLDYDVDAVTGSGSIPAGVDIDIVVMIMDHFKLSLAIERVNLSENSTLDLNMNLVSVQEFINQIKSID